MNTINYEAIEDEEILFQPHIPLIILLR